MKKNPVKNILNLMGRIDETFDPSKDNVTDFTSVQDYAKNKYGNFNHLHNGYDLFNGPKNDFYIFDKIKMFLKDIIGKKIQISNIQNSQDDTNYTNQEYSDNEIIRNVITNSLSKSAQKRDGLLGTVFEGLLMKAPDFSSGSDLTHFELKTTMEGSNKITMFQKPFKGNIDFSKSVNALINELGIEFPNISLSLEKTHISKKNRLTPNNDGQQSLSDFFTVTPEVFNDSTKKEVGFLGDASEVNSDGSNTDFADFYLNLNVLEDKVVFTLSAIIRKTNNESVRIGDERVLFEYPVLYADIQQNLNIKMKNVFHVKGKILQEKEVYAVFTDYEAMIMKEGLSLRNLILEGIIIPSFRAKFYSSYHQEMENKEKEELSAQQHLNTMKQNDDEKLQQNLDFDNNEVNEERAIRYAHETATFNDKVTTVLVSRGITFKVNISRLNELYVIDKSR